MKSITQSINESNNPVMDKQLDMIVKNVNIMLAREDVDVVVYELLDAISQNRKDDLVTNNIKSWANQH